MSSEWKSVGFQPHLYCPHCGKHQMAEMTGYARYGLSARSKFCKHCGEEFVLNVLVQTSPDGIEYEDMFDRMTQEKLKRIKRKTDSEQVSNPIACPHAHSGCEGQLIKQKDGYWTCNGVCRSSFRVNINGTAL